MKLFNVPGDAYGIRSEILNHQIWDIPSNALIIKLAEHHEVLSSREGLKQVSAICNAYLPEETWPIFDKDPGTWDTYLDGILSLSGCELEETAILSTGVTMEYLACGEEVYGDLWVQVFVTAGVQSNAMRIGMDKARSIEINGGFGPVGTINIVVFTSVGLDLSGMASSFITITEAKNIALQEMDVRSVFNPEYLATGTGTDTIIIVPGKGEHNRYIGGHTKLGEMVARCVTGTTVEALRKSLAHPYKKQ